MSQPETPQKPSEYCEFCDGIKNDFSAGKDPNIFDFCHCRMAAPQTPQGEILIQAAKEQSHSVECGAVTENEDGTFNEKMELCDCGLWLTLELAEAFRQLQQENNTFRKRITQYCDPLIAAKILSAISPSAK